MTHVPPTTNPAPKQGESSPSNATGEKYARLVFRGRDGKQVIKNVLRPTTLIGSSPKCNIQLVSDSVSHFHAILTLDDDTLRVRDLRSRTGTKVNGTFVDVAEVWDGDTIEIGPFRFVVETNLGVEVEGPEPAEQPERARLFPGGGRTQVGSYRVLDILGRGGMAWLYLAEHVETGQKCVLKVLPEEEGKDAGIRARFLLEAETGMKLDHPHIVKTLAVDCTQGLYYDIHYAVLEFIEGITLLELVQRCGPLPWRQVCDIIRQAAVGLESVHRCGIIHRDVKPSNLLIDRTGHVKILDFGLAKWDEEGDEFSLAMIFGHNCLGTADFIAPEQTRDSYTVDVTADIFSLGGTMYFALTGRVPFPGKTIREKLEAARVKDPKPIKELAPSVPTEVAQIVDKMMAKSPGDRFQSAAEVARALSPFCERRPVEFDFSELLEARQQEALQRTGTTENGETVLRDPLSSLSRLAVAAEASSALTGNSDGQSHRPSKSKRSETSQPKVPAELLEQVRDVSPELVEVVKRWPELPPNIRRGILALLDTSGQ